MIWWRVMLVWLLLAVLAVANGAVRVKLVQPRIGEARAHVVASLTFIAMLAVVSWFSILWMAPGSAFWAVGFTWTASTVLFEFGFGHWVMGHPWSKLLADYDVTKGRIWSLVLFATLVLPQIMGRLR